MLGDHRQRLQRPAGRRGPERQAPAAAQAAAASASPISSAWAKPARVSGVCGGLALHPAGGVEHGLAVAGDEAAACHRRGSAGQGGGVDRGRRAAQPVVVADERAARRAGLDDHVDAGAHRRDDLLVGAAVRRPGVAAAAAQLEAAAVDPEQHRRAGPLLAAQADVELAADARAGQWPTEANGRQPSAAGPPNGCGDRIAAVAGSRNAPQHAEHAERLRCAAAGAPPSRMRNDRGLESRMLHHRRADAPLATSRVWPFFLVNSTGGRSRGLAITLSNRRSGHAGVIE